MCDLSWSEDRKTASEDRTGWEVEEKSVQILQGTSDSRSDSNVPKAFIPKDSNHLGIKSPPTLMVFFFNFQNCFVTLSDFMIIYMPAFCLNHMIDEESKFKGQDARGDEALLFWFKHIPNDNCLKIRANRPNRATLCYHSSAAWQCTCTSKNMHTSVLPVLVVESAWTHWPNFPQLARLVGDQQSSPPISPNWAYQSIQSLCVSIFLFPPSVPVCTDAHSSVLINSEESCMCFDLEC